MIRSTKNNQPKNLKTHRTQCGSSTSMVMYVHREEKLLLVKNTLTSKINYKPNTKLCIISLNIFSTKAGASNLSISFSTMMQLIGLFILIRRWNPTLIPLLKTRKKILLGLKSFIGDYKVLRMKTWTLVKVESTQVNLKGAYLFYMFY